MAIIAQLASMAAACCLAGAKPSLFFLGPSSPAAPGSAAAGRRPFPATVIRLRPAKAAGSLAAEDTAGDRRSTGELAAWNSVRQKRWEGDLAVEGNLPAWLKGTYLRNGPGLLDVGGTALHHLFDGYAMLVRVSFRGGRAAGAHRQVETDAYRSAVACGRPVLREFSQHPKPRNLLERVAGAAGFLTGAAVTDNANVTVQRLGDGRVLCLTESTKGAVLVDPGSLATVGKLTYADGMVLQCAHAFVAESGELLTLLTDFAPPGYVAVRMEAGSSERKVVGRVSCRGGPTPAWMHSFAVTDKYIVVPEMPLRYSPNSMFTAEPGPLYIFDWLPESGSYIHVMCRSTGKTVASVEVPPFMAIHFINAYEVKGENGQPAAVVVDCCEYYGDASILNVLALHKLRSSKEDDDAFPDSRVARFRIPLDGSSPSGELETALDPEEHGGAVDMCSINHAYIGREHRYVYACGARRPSYVLNTLTKIDLAGTTAKSWHERGAVPSEPLFVARPGATDEDDGVVISVVSAGDGGGYAVVLDAATFEEIARVRLPYGLPYGFHGTWIPDEI